MGVPPKKGDSGGFKPVGLNILLEKEIKAAIRRAAPAANVSCFTAAPTLNP